MSDLFKRTEQGTKRARDGIFGRILRLFSSSRLDESIWGELEELLILADVGASTTGKLLDSVKERAREEKVDSGEYIKRILKEEMIKIIDLGKQSTITNSNSDRLVILVVGVNGTGKTTSIAKLAGEYKQAGKRVMLGAADTFRAAAIDQLKVWGARIGVEVIAHQSGADPGAVVYDTLQAAQSRKADIVIIDTAGRLQTKHNLMDELKKIKKVIAKYDVVSEVLLVIDATTGQNGLSQARHFMEATDVNGIFITKLDGTAKGGIVFAICDELKIPIKYIGVGEKMEDIAPFDAVSFVNAIFGEHI